MPIVIKKANKECENNDTENYSLVDNYLENGHRNCK